MPFVSESQRRYCWIKYNADIRRGIKPSWDCHEFEKEGRKTSRRSTSRRKSHSRSTSRRSTSRRKSTSPKNTPYGTLGKMSRGQRQYSRQKVGRKIYKGSRGGSYVKVNSKKVYIY